MPQWPLHCAVGIVDTHKEDESAAKLASALQGTVLSLQPDIIRDIKATQSVADKYKSSGLRTDEAAIIR
jgi:hypothetical protein